MNVTYSLGKQEESHHLTLVDYSLRLPRNAEFRRPKGPVSIRRRNREVVKIGPPPRETQRQISGKRHGSQESKNSFASGPAVKAITDGTEHPSQAQERLETARKYIEVCEESQRATIRFEELRKRRKLHCHLEELLRAAAIRAAKVQQKPSGGDNDEGDHEPNGDNGEDAGGDGGKDHKPHRRHHHRRHGENDKERNPHHRHHHKHGRQHQDGSYSDSELSYSDYSDSNSEYMDDVEYIQREPQEGEGVPKRNSGRFDVRRYSGEGNNYSDDTSGDLFSVSQKSIPGEEAKSLHSVEKEELSRRLSHKSSSEPVRVCAEHVISHNISERGSSNIDVLVVELEPSCKISNHSSAEHIRSKTPEAELEERPSCPNETTDVDDVVPFDNKRPEEEQPHCANAQSIPSKNISNRASSEKPELLELVEKDPSTKAESNKSSSKKEQGSTKSSPTASKSTDSWISEQSQKLRKDLLHQIIMEAMSLPADESEDEDEYDKLIAEVMDIQSSEERDMTTPLKHVDDTREVEERVPEESVRSEERRELNSKSDHDQPSQRSCVSPGPCGCRNSDDVQACRANVTAGIMDEVIELYVVCAEEYRSRAVNKNGKKVIEDCYSQHSSWSEEDPNYLSDKEAAAIGVSVGAAAAPREAVVAAPAPTPAAANPRNSNVGSYPKKQEQPALRAPSKKMKERRPNEIEETGCFC